MRRKQHPLQSNALNPSSFNQNRKTIPMSDQHLTASPQERNPFIMNVTSVMFFRIVDWLVFFVGEAIAPTRIRIVLGCSWSNWHFLIIIVIVVVDWRNPRRSELERELIGRLTENEIEFKLADWTRFLMDKCYGEKSRNYGVDGTIACLENHWANIAYRFHSFASKKGICASRQ